MSANAKDNMSIPTERTATAIDPIINAYRSGHQTVLLSGRSLFDLHINERGELRPLRHTLIRRAREEFGMTTLLYNLALGPRWSWEGFDGKERRDFESKLEAARVPLYEEVRNNITGRPPHERAVDLLKSIQQTIEQGSDIPPVLALLEWGEDLVPDSERGAINDWIMQMNELLVMIGSDYLRRRHPFLMVLAGTPERMDRRVVNSLQPVHLAQPERDEKTLFIQMLRGMPHLKGASYEEGLDDSAVANLTARTPNQSLEEAFFESDRTGRPITHTRIVERKRADVVALSEGTMTLLDAERVAGIKLVGRTIEHVLTLLLRWAQGLKQGDPLTPMNILLAGAPSSAKTDLALFAALMSQTPAYALLSPKGSLVGQTEKLVRLLFRIFKELSPAFGVIDEITEAWQTQRNSTNLDSGASDSVLAEMLTALSDSSRAGRTLLIATTNCPWKIGAAAADRFMFVPVLSALEEDFSAILCAIGERLLPDADWDASSAEVKNAATVFYRKNATPRTMRSILSSKIASGEERVLRHLLPKAAADCAPRHPRDRASAEYADLYAISVCSDLALLPWHNRIFDYPLPAYLKGIVSETDGTIDIDRLNRRIEELRPNVNV
ncbi:MAG TPA: AAA family ATPase [Chthoniobacterales bacterium]|nr:AAA family ATPase [Chthoniobacterales bacterium]